MAGESLVVDACRHYSISLLFHYLPGYVHCVLMAQPPGQKDACQTFSEFRPPSPHFITPLEMGPTFTPSSYSLWTPRGKGSTIFKALNVWERWIIQHVWEFLNSDLSDPVESFAVWLIEIIIVKWQYLGMSAMMWRVYMLHIALIYQIWKRTGSWKLVNFGAKRL